MHRLWSTPEVVRFISGTPSTREESWARLLRYLGHWSAFGFGFFVVTDRTTGRYLGECGMMDFRREIDPPLLDGMAEAGWVFAAEAWGQGLATEAMAEVMAWYETRTDAPPAACIIAPENAASIRVATKLGFALAGDARRRDHVIGVYRKTPTGDP